MELHACKLQMVISRKPNLADRGAALSRPAAMRCYQAVEGL